MKALFFDIDGTLVDNKTKQLPKSAVNILKELRNKGHKVILNSGRVYCMLQGILNDIDVDGFICGCGTQINIDTQLIYKNKITIDRANFIKERLLEYNFEAILEAQDKAYMSSIPFKNKNMDRLYDIVSKLCHIELNSFGDKTYTFDKFCIIDENGRKNPLLRKFIDELNDFYIIDRNNSFYEFVPKGNSKGEAILKTLEYYNISLDDCYVFGDSMNDLTMFTCGARHRIIMKKHDKSLEKYASFETKDVLDDGIEYAIKSLNIL